ncbi:MAG: cation:proton antiporter [Thermoanaerobaculia bacterium]|nr:cation:proton antiporter [Thermoanaerobaculia bacterium]
MDPIAALTTITIAIAAGAALVALARRLELSAIVLLLIGGVILGPSGLGLVRPESLGGTLRLLVTMAVSVILFEGGLSLELEGWRRGGSLIRRLLTVGVLVTWLGASGAIWLLFDHSVPFSLLAGSLVIVTGPTVIAPLLKRVKIEPRLHHVLHWEGVLIDPIGVFVAILCFEFVAGHHGGVALGNFGLRLLLGTVAGLVMGGVIAGILRRRLVPDDMTNSVALAGALLTYGGTEALAAHHDLEESGLLAVVVAGLVVGVLRPARLRRLRHFKAELTELMIGLLFVVLAANLDLDRFLAFGARGAVLVALVLFLVRPLSVFASSFGLEVGWRDRLFLATIAPRGIVAASMASLFAIDLSDRTDLGVDPAFLETFTYSVIAATVLFGGLAAKPMARALGLQRSRPRGWIIVGGHALGRRLAEHVADLTSEAAVLVETNRGKVARARAEGLEVLHEDARSPELLEEIGFARVGNLLAVTPNEDLNSLLCVQWSREFGEDRVFRWGQGPPTDSEDRLGRTVWPWMPNPGLVAGEIEAGEARVEVARAGEPLPRDATALLSITQDGLDLDPQRSGDLPTVYLRRRADYLRRSLRPDLSMRLAVESVEELFEAMVDRLEQAVPELDRQRVVEELLERERTIPSAFGHGVAVPHFYSEAVEERLCLVARLDEGLAMGSHDDRPVRLVFLLASPPGDPEGHLETLAELSRLFSDPRSRERLLDQGDPSDVVRIARRTKIEDEPPEGRSPNRE